MQSIVVLSHLMSKSGMLGDESIARANLSVQLFKTNKFQYLITSGWDYRHDCKYRICDVVKDYIIKISDINPKKIIVLPQSRDTVGDAYFSLRLVKKLGINKLVVITSDYHVNRVEIIFNKFFSDYIPIEIVGVPSKSKNVSSVIKKELDSLREFESTFKFTDFSDVEAIYKCLIKKHPFYNGDVHPQFVD